MNFLQTIDLMAALKAALEAIELAPGVKLFDRVDYFSSPNLLNAFDELRIFKRRVCLIVPSADDYTNRVEGASLTTNTTREFILLLADRDYGVRQRAQIGDSDDPIEKPGVLRMKDKLEAELLGSDLGNSPRLVALRPTEGQAFVLQGKDRDEAAGREGWQMTWIADAGDAITQLPS